LAVSSGSLVTAHTEKQIHILHCLLIILRLKN